ncbi:glutaminyl-peptide cyclotransferase [Reichenbachiella versicolor]|uniref:glutaminyl-peptide cyclotransferase n=1 Tax=Reichenbachiella versicolor TaxID=1821036 RepID=UPI000D6E7239|nr:glutaminyl-peptide cyclotransferase [Reichenbachiella versicolor]
MRKLQLLLLSTVLCCVALCNCGTKAKQKPETARIKSKVKVISPKNGFKIVDGDSLNIQFSLKNESTSIDSFQIEIENKKIVQQGFSSLVSTEGIKMGRQNIDYTIFLSDGTQERKRSTIIVKSNKRPKAYTYRIVKQYPHSKKAFTQGLTIRNGELFESTGQNGMSSIRKIDVSTGEILAQKNLESQFFGEGSTIIDDKIYMLTWTKNTGFLFDRNTLEKIGEFSYPSEGWGLTNMGDTLILSDGSSNIYFKEKESFTDIGAIQVYDNKGPIDDLNELEYINGKIFANRWMTDLVYIISPKTGKVEAVINLEGLLTSKERNDISIDVLNGIAYDKQLKKLYVTGKNWPSLFEIELIERAKP